MFRKATFFFVLDNICYLFCSSMFFLHSLYYYKSLYIFVKMSTLECESCCGFIRLLVNWNLWYNYELPGEFPEEGNMVVGEESDFQLLIGWVLVRAGQAEKRQIGVTNRAIGAPLIITCWHDAVCFIDVAYSGMMSCPTLHQL